MNPCSLQEILWFGGNVKVTAIRFSPTSLSDHCRFEQRREGVEAVRNGQVMNLRGIRRNKKALYILSIWVGFGWWESEDI